MFKRRLGVVEQLGYAVFLAGFIVFVVNGGMRLPWMTWAAALMAVGAVIAGRGGDAPSS